MEFLRSLWRAARFWPDPGMGLRPGSNNAVFVTFLILLFSIVGVVLVMLGFDLKDVDVWLEAQGGWLDAAGSFLFKALLAFIVLMCAILLLASLYDGVFARDKKDRLGIRTALLALVIGYFAGVGLLD